MPRVTNQKMVFGILQEDYLFSSISLAASDINSSGYPALCGLLLFDYE